MVVITGASGLLGLTLVDHFSKRNIPVTALYRKSKQSTHDNVTWVECDVTDINSLTQIFTGASCVVHAAALVSFARKHKDKMFQTNVEGTANVVNACLKAGVKRLIHVSSVAALGKSLNQNIVTEDSPWPGTYTPSNYGLTKYLAELEVYRGEAEGISVAMVNPSIILSSTDLKQSSGQIFQYLKNGGAFYTDGHINYVDARDVAEAVYRLYENSSIRGRYILNSGTISWKFFFEKVSDKLGRKPPYIRVPPHVTLLAAAVEMIRSIIMGSEPIVTRETANLARQYVSYSNEKAVSQLAMVFKELDETLNWCCK
jgi:nucleoside-diphosphate-sugar epimerase